MSVKELAGAAGSLGVRFNLLGLLPAAVLASFICALLAAGTPGSRPDLEKLRAHIDGLSSVEAVTLSGAVLVAALIVQPLQLSLVRILEGYWGSGVLGRTIARPCTARHRRRRQVLEAAARTTNEVVDRSERQALVVASQRLRGLYPPEPFLLPTGLGNVLRAAEYRAGRPYGLDAVVTWPRLYPLLNPGVRAIVDDLRLQLDVAARFTATFVLAAVVSAPLLGGHGPWLAVSVGAFGLAWVSYRSTVAAASAYGSALEAAFDLTHLELRKTLHLSWPASRKEERESNRDLTQFFLGIPTDLHYEPD